MAVAIKNYAQRSTLALASSFFFFFESQIYYISRQCQKVRLLPGQHFPPDALQMQGVPPACMDNKLPEGYDNGITRHFTACHV